MSTILVLIAAAFVIWALVDIFRSNLATNKNYLVCGSNTLTTCWIHSLLLCW